MARNLEEGNLYPTATGQPEVRAAVERFRALPEEERAKHVLLYWLLLESTPAYKESPQDAHYTDWSASNEKQCQTCRFLYQKVITGDFICSQISIHVQPGGYCRLWKG